VVNALPKPLKRIKDAALMARLHLELAGEPCEVCGIRIGTILHHVKYRSRGGDDVRIDELGRTQLLWVCSICDSDHGALPSISRYE
jgi:hypothetical protein